MEYLKKFYVYSVEDFDAFHRQAFPNASKSTYHSFEQSLKRIEKVYDSKLQKLDLSFVKDPKELWDKLNASNYTQNTIITTYTHILKLLKLMDIPLHHYNKFLEILNYHSSKRQAEQQEELREKLEFLPDFTSLRNVVKSRIKVVDFNLQFTEMKHLVLMAIMTLSVPMKPTNFVNMRKAYFDGNEQSNWFIYDEEDNFEFHYKSNIVKVVDKDLQKLLELWINGYNTTKYFFISNEDSKKPMSAKELRTTIAMASKDIFDIALTATDLRTAYMKYLIDLDPDMEQKVQLSRLLGYQTTDRLDLHKII